jgi:hypothetical protein
MAKAEKKVEDQVELEDAETLEVVETEGLEGDELDESAASATLKPNSMPVGAANKAAAIGKVVDAMAGMDKETINKFVATINQIGHEADSIGGGEASSNKNTINAKPSGAGVQLVAKLESLDASVSDLIREDVTEIFEGTDLTEEFKTKVSTLIESVINLKTAERVAAIEEEYESKYNEEMDIVAENLVETLDDYLSYAVGEWMDQNIVAIESAVRADLAEGFMENLKDLLSTHYIDVPEDRVDIIEEMSQRIEELELLASEKIDEAAELAAAIDNLEAVEVVSEMTKGLTESDAEKLIKLSESVEYISIDDLKTKVGILKEQHFKGEVTKPAQTVLFEETDKIAEDEEPRKVRGPMDAYVQSISRTVRK